MKRRMLVLGVSMISSLIIVTVLIVIRITVANRSKVNSVVEVESKYLTEGKYEEVIEEDKSSEIVGNDDNIDYNNFQNQHYTSYSGIKYEYPEFLIEDKSNTTTNSITFYSPGKSIKLMICSENNDKGILVDNLYQEYLNSHENISLNVKKDDNFTISGVDGENIYYYSAIVNKNTIEYFEIIYPVTRKNEFNSIVENLYSCLKPKNNTINSISECIIGEWRMEGDEKYILTITDSTFGGKAYTINKVEENNTIYISTEEDKWCINIIDNNNIHIYWYNEVNGFYTGGTSYYRVVSEGEEGELSIISKEKLWSILSGYTGSGIGIKDFTYDDDLASKETINYNGRTCWKFENIDRNGNLIGAGIIVDIFTGEYWIY